MLFFLNYQLVSASDEHLFEIVAWQKMNTRASNCLIMSVYIYSILFPSSKYSWGPSIVRRMRTTANLYKTLPQTSRAGIAAAMAARDCLWQSPSRRMHTTENGGSPGIF